MTFALAPLSRGRLTCLLTSIRVQFLQDVWCDGQAQRKQRGSCISLYVGSALVQWKRLCEECFGTVQRWPSQGAFGARGHRCTLLGFLLSLQGIVGGGRWPSGLLLPPGPQNEPMGRCCWKRTSRWAQSRKSLTAWSALRGVGVGIPLKRTICTCGLSKARGGGVAGGRVCTFCCPCMPVLGSVLHLPLTNALRVFSASQNPTSSTPSWAPM